MEYCIEFESISFPCRYRYSYLNRHINDVANVQQAIDIVYKKGSPSLFDSYRIVEVTSANDYFNQMIQMNKVVVIIDRQAVQSYQDFRKASRIEIDT